MFEVGRFLLNVRLLAVLASLTLLGAAPASLGKGIVVRPADNDAVYGTQLGLHSLFAGGVATSLAAPWPADVAGDALALSSELTLGATPPLLVVPSDRQRFPNHPGTGLDTSRSESCVFRFLFDTDSEAEHEAGLQDTFASVWSVPIRIGNVGFADLGKPVVYHPYGEVQVNAEHRYLTPSGYPGLSEEQLEALRVRPEFPEGTHAINWRGDKMTNPVIDIALPSALFATFTYAEFRIQQRLARKLISKSYAKFQLQLLDTVSKLELAGTTGYDIATAAGAEEFLADTSFVAARNEGTQLLTVWDTHPPYFIDNNGNRIVEQIVSVEAQDFGGIRFDRAQRALEAQFELHDDCGKPVSLITDTEPGRLLTLNNDNEVLWDANDRGPFNSSIDASLASNQSRDGDEVNVQLRQIVRVVDTQPPLLVPPDSFAIESASAITPAAGFRFSGTTACDRPRGSGSCCGEQRPQ